MQIVAIIPARYGSQRFPGKPLAAVAGRSLIEHVWRTTKVAKGLDAVYVATDDERIATHVTGFGGQVLMTSPDCANGTERSAAAIKQLPQKPDGVLNIQGDAILTPPWVIHAMAEALRADAAQKTDIVTPAVPLDWQMAATLEKEKEVTPASGTLVVTDHNGYALYFSKNMIPYIRKRPEACPYLRHIGLYGFRYDALMKFISLPKAVLEEVEGLEQLRALVSGMTIKVVPVDYKNRQHGSIDSPEDVVRVEAILATEGLPYEL